MKNVAVINVEFYTGVDERLDVPVMLPPVPSTVDLSGARVLIADHVADGRCAVLYQKPHSTVDANTCGDARIAGSTSRGRTRPRLGP